MPSRPAIKPMPAITGLLEQFATHPLVALGEMHGLQEEADFITALLHHPAFPATVQVITQVLDRFPIEAQGYLPCQNILGGLGKKNKARLEAACQQALNLGGYPTYSTLKRIMGMPARMRPGCLTWRVWPSARRTKAGGVR